MPALRMTLIGVSKFSVKPTTPEAHHDIEEKIMDFLRWHRRKGRKETVPAGFDIEQELNLFEPGDTRAARIAKAGHR